jgi:hypothetical protein
MSEPIYSYIWVFNGAGWQSPSGTFSSKMLAERWIASYRLSGLLTAYPVDISVYDWAIREGVLEPKGRDEAGPEYISKFSHASQEHYHYENGVLEGVGATVEQLRRVKMGISEQPIWLFNGENYPLPSAAFSSRTNAETWIKSNLLTGSLTLYPVDTGIYDWAISRGTFKPESMEEKTPEFIQQFTLSGQERYLYKDGNLT